MKVILQKDVKDLGKVGDLVNVKTGFARNFLFPKSLAMIATEGKVKEWAHIQHIIKAKQKKAQGDRKSLLDGLKDITLNIKSSANDSDMLFGSISNMDVSKLLEKQGHLVDRKDIKMEPIKILGQHKAIVDLGNDLTTEIAVNVERDQ